MIRTSTLSDAVRQGAFRLLLRDQSEDRVSLLRYSSLDYLVLKFIQVGSLNGTLDWHFVQNSLLGGSIDHFLTDW